MSTTSRVLHASGGTFVNCAVIISTFPSCFHEHFQFAHQIKKRTCHQKGFMLDWGSTMIKAKCQEHRPGTWSMWLNQPLKLLLRDENLRGNKQKCHISIVFSTLLSTVWLEFFLITSSCCVLLFCNSLMAPDRRISHTTCLSCSDLYLSLSEDLYAISSE